MAINLTGEYSKKLGLPGFSSHQFSVSIQAELTDPDHVPSEVARLYRLLQGAVDREIQQPGFVPGPAYGQSPQHGGGPAHPARLARPPGASHAPAAPAPSLMALPLAMDDGAPPPPETGPEPAPPPAVEFVALPERDARVDERFAELGQQLASTIQVAERSSLWQAVALFFIAIAAAAFVGGAAMGSRARHHSHRPHLAYGSYHARSAPRRAHHAYRPYGAPRRPRGAYRDRGAPRRPRGGSRHGRPIPQPLPASRPSRT